MKKALFIAQIKGAALATLVFALSTLVYHWKTKQLTRTTKANPSLDYYVHPTSFSEVENTRALLSGLAARALADWDERYIAFFRNPACRDDPGMRNQFLEELEELRREFAGSDKQEIIVQRLLLVLGREKQMDRWMDLYLENLYENPLQAMNLTNAEEAVDYARKTHRELDLLSAFELLASIPEIYGNRLEPVKEAVLVLRKATQSGVNIPSRS